MEAGGSSEGSALEREKSLLKYYDDNIKWYRRNSERNRFFHRVFGVVSLVLSTIIPLITAAAGSDSASLAVGVEQKELTFIAVCLGAVLAIGEGLRRFFSFERSWISFYTSWITIKHQREFYLDIQAKLPCGSDEWWKNFNAARNQLNEYISGETRGFFEALRDQGASKTPQGANA